MKWQEILKKIKGRTDMSASARSARMAGKKPPSRLNREKQGKEKIRESHTDDLWVSNYDDTGVAARNYEDEETWAEHDLAEIDPFQRQTALAEEYGVDADAFYDKNAEPEKPRTESEIKEWEEWLENRRLKGDS